jgi:enoyl-[acyl-carrier protein] reductase/trans-2-enoyl-CoA reductase (NAD+)
MNIQPKIRGFICTTAHPQGCMQHVNEQIEFVSQFPALTNAPKKVLVIGASTGYGLASRIVAAFGGQAKTIGVFFEKEADGKRTASAGWYNSAGFEQQARSKGLYAKSINGDAFSDDIKQKTIDLIKQDWQGGVDLVVYSLASPRRTHPKTGEVFNSTLKPIGKPYTSKTIDVMSGAISEITLEPATQQDIDQTTAVMGGEDWQMWMHALLEANVLAKGAMTVAYSYIGPQLTYPIYREGTIGNAKSHLEATAKQLTKELSAIEGKAFVSVNKALVTQASAAIPVVPLYVSLLYKIMKAKQLHEGCIEQIWRMFTDRLYTGQAVPVDEHGLIRLDDYEMKADVQSEVATLWDKVTTDNIMALSDLTGYRHEFHKLFGFEVEGVDYTADCSPEVAIESIESGITV